METSLHDGQYLLVNKLVYRFRSPNRGDVIIFTHPSGHSSSPYVKRVVGLPGEEVEVKDGRVYIDGSLLDEPEYILSTRQGCDPTVVGDDEYFVLGDNRDHSSDSRDFGPTPRDNIIGKVWFCYWPIGYWGFSPSYEPEIL